VILEREKKAASFGEKGAGLSAQRSTCDRTPEEKEMTHGRCRREPGVKKRRMCRLRGGGSLRAFVAGGKREGECHLAFGRNQGEKKKGVLPVVARGKRCRDSSEKRKDFDWERRGGSRKGEGAPVPLTRREKRPPGRKEGVLIRL